MLCSLSVDGCVDLLLVLFEVFAASCPHRV